MLMKQIIDAYEVLDSSFVTGEAVKEYLLGIKADANVEVYELVGPKGSTDMLKVRIPGKNGKTNGGDAPTIGLLGRLGGIGARPERIGFVSDGDGALCAVALAAKLLDMQNKGDYLDGDVFISTHICPHAPTAPHDPVPFMGSPVEMAQVNKEEVSPDLDALLVVDTTKGNRVINTRGFAISPTVKEGYVLRTSEDLLDLMQITTGRLPYVFPLATQDITPYGNAYHSSAECKTLKLSIRSVPRTGISALRSEDGSIYYPCRCAGTSSKNVYITDYGTEYHGNIACSGLKRTVYRVLRSQVGDRHPCMRCQK